MSYLHASGGRLSGSCCRDAARADSQGKTKLRAVFALFILSFLLSHTACGLNPSSRITQYAHTAWKVGDNGLRSLPTGIAQTSDGLIWIGTLDGLFYFDGVRFTRWTAPGQAAFDENIGYLLGSHDGSLFLATAPSRVFRLKSGKLFHYTNSLVAAGPFLQDDHGEVWLGSWGSQNKAGTLCKLADDHASCFAARPAFPCVLGSSLVLDRNGAIWIGSHEGVCQWNGDSRNIDSTGEAPKSTASSMYVKTLARDSTGTLWAGVVRTGKGYGLLRFDH
jgi:ligand-binding sensor domain-containing protein